MKLLLVGMILSLFVVTGCGSKEKEAETTMADTTEQMESKSEEMVEEAEEKVEEMADAAEEKAEEMTSEKMASSFNCSLGSDDRTIEIVNGENPKCEVFYSKNGERLSVARANWDASYCDKVAGQVKGNLENAGYSCN